MSVELSPASVLGFNRPLTQTVKKTLTIHNPHPSPIAFKVKTTAPKQYCVRPNSGRVEPGQSVEVQVLLQALADEPPPHAKCKDKFLVQSAFISPDEEMKTLAEMWSQTEKTNKAAIQEQKIKCAFLPAEDGSTGAQGIPEEEEHAANGDQSRMLDESISPKTFGTPRDGLSHWTTVPEKRFDPTLFRNGGLTYWEEVKQDPVTPSKRGQIYSAAESSPANTGARSPTTSVPVPAHAEAPTSSSKPTTIEPPLPPLTATSINEKGPSPTNAALEQSLSATTSDSDKLKAALAEIERLKGELSEAQGPQVTGLRKRGGASAQAGAETVVEKAKEVVATSQGVPVEIVGGLVLAVFVLTYLFF